MNRVCRDCGNRFQGEDWKTRCITCFIEMKRAQEHAGDLRAAREAGYREGYAVGRLAAGPSSTLTSCAT